MVRRNRRKSRVVKKIKSKPSVSKPRIRRNAKNRERGRTTKEHAALNPSTLPDSGQASVMYEIPPVEPLHIKFVNRTIKPYSRHPAISHMTVFRPAIVPRGVKLIPEAYTFDICPPSIRNPVYKKSNTSTNFGYIPYDLLYEIFVLCLPLELERRTRRREAPLVLCQVCRYWRQTALSIPLLWSGFSATNRPGKKHLFHPKMLQLFLDRSRSRPLAFKFSSSLEACDSEHRYMEVLMSHSARWKEVSFYIGDSKRFAHLYLSVTHTPILETLIIDAKACYTMEILEGLAMSMGHMNQLRRLAWRSMRVPSTMLSIPFEKLTHFDLWCPICLEDCVRILQSCFQLVWLRIDVKATSYRFPVSTVVSIPTLTHLDVIPYCDLAIFLAYFHFPALRSIRVMHRRGFVHDFAGLEAFCTRSGCTLESFWLNDRRQASSTVIQYLSLPCLQSIHEFHIFSGNLDDRFVQALMVPKRPCDGPLLLPRLKKLIMGRCLTSDGLVASMLESRCRSTEGLAAGTQLTMARAVFKKSTEFERAHGFRRYHSIDLQGFKSFPKSEVKISWGWQ